ncbi:hypothetical protein ACHAXT_009892 [Thalassiosira profunda]
MSLSGTGRFREPTCPSAEGSHRHPWHPPEINADPIASGHLLIRNTLTGQKEPFVPMKDRHVRWYTCGPTVYDSSHVGHARTYLSFDIMRRVMTDYFHYNVLYQINTTDIDDKIILRARQNELLRQLEADASVDYAKLTVMAKEAVGEAKAESDKKRAKIEAALAEAVTNGDSRARTEQEGLLEQHAVKRKNLDDDEANVLKACGASPDEKDARANLLAAAKSVLAEKLDREKGHLVTDHAVFNAHARKYEREYMEDMAALGIREPDVLTRVTEYVPQIIAFVEKIIEKGLAYKSNGSVYLSLDAFQAAGHNYRKLNPAGPGGAATSAAEMAEGEGALAAGGDGEKRNPNDFALWKASKSGEPAWDSPFGPGRPGWHIECSAVRGGILGGSIRTPSAEGPQVSPPRQRAGAVEACFGCQQWINYFTHTGHLHIEGLKMSKSLKNFVTIRQALEHNTARQLRIIIALQVEALVREDYLADEVGWRMGEADHTLAEAYLGRRSQLMAALLKAINEANAYLRAPNARPSTLLFRAIATYVSQPHPKVLRVVRARRSRAAGAAGAGGGGASNRTLAAMVAFRWRFRNAALDAAKGGDAKAAIQSILKICDGLRDETLPTLGVRLEDRPAGTMWNLEDPEVMLKEMAVKKAQEQEIAIGKLEKQLVARKRGGGRGGEEQLGQGPRDLGVSNWTGGVLNGTRSGVITFWRAAIRSGQVKKREKGGDDNAGQGVQ